MKAGVVLITLASTLLALAGCTTSANNTPTASPSPNDIRQVFHTSTEGVTIYQLCDAKNGVLIYISTRNYGVYWTDTKVIAAPKGGCE